MGIKNNDVALENEIKNARTLMAQGALYDLTGNQHAFGMINSLNKKAYDCSGLLSAIVQTKYNNISGLLNPKNRKEEFLDVKNNE